MQFCSPAAQRCLSPAAPYAPTDKEPAICNASTAASVCSASTATGTSCCDPTTRVLAKAGAPCAAAAACGAGSYCSPTRRRCLTPVMSTVCSVSGAYSYNAGSCRPGEVCSPGTRTCVRYRETAADCANDCGEGSAGHSYCNLEGRCATPVSRPGAHTPCVWQTLA